MENEIWKDIPGYNGMYQVSNMGRVKSLHYNREHILKPGKNGKGYYQVKLYKNGSIARPTVHKLVYTIFVGPIPKGLEVNHHDEEKTNNSIANLELMTPEDNHNFGTRNERAGMSCRKRISMLDKNGNYIRSFTGAVEAAEYLNINPHRCTSNICECLKGKLKTAYGYRWEYENEKPEVQ